MDAKYVNRLKEFANRTGCAVSVQNDLNSSDDPLFAGRYLVGHTVVVKHNNSEYTFYIHAAPHGDATADADKLMSILGSLEDNTPLTMKTPGILRNFKGTV